MTDSAVPTHWRCSHCEDLVVELHEAVEHIDAYHSRCFGCMLERHMAEAALAGEGHWLVGPGPF